MTISEEAVARGTTTGTVDHPHFAPADVFPLNQLVNTTDGWLSTSTAAVSKTAEYHLCKNIRGYVTTTPFSIELLRCRCFHCFVYYLFRRTQMHYELSHLQQHLTIVYY